MKAHYWAAILNGVVAAPLMAVIMIMISSRKVMGKLVIPLHLKGNGLDCHPGDAMRLYWGIFHMAMTLRIIATQADGLSG